MNPGNPLEFDLISIKFKEKRRNSSKMVENNFVNKWQAGSDILKIPTKI